MGRRARNIRSAKKNQEKQKRKAAKQARFASAQEAQRNRRLERSGKWRGLTRTPVRNRKKSGGTVSLKVFERLARRKDNERRSM